VRVSEEYDQRHGIEYNPSYFDIHVGGATGKMYDDTTSIPIYEFFSL
jgi:hypothetical protein